jgi:hypothetical protein
MVPSGKYTYFIYGHVKNTNNGAAITLLHYFTSASATSAKYCCLLYGTFNKNIYTPPSATNTFAFCYGNFGKYSYSTYEHGKNHFYVISTVLS